MLSACASPQLPVCDVDGPPLHAWIVDYGLHTEIVIPASQLEGGLAPFRALFPSARTLSFGFGKADFFTLREPGVLDYAAGIVPGPGDMRVIPLGEEPQTVYNTPIIRIPLSPAERSRLDGFIGASFARNTSGGPITAPGDDGTGGRFFAATPGYSLGYTCNAWTVDALYRSGLPVATGSLFSGSAMRQVARISGACTYAPKLSGKGSAPSPP